MCAGLRGVFAYSLASLKSESGYVSVALLVQQVSGFTTVLLLARILGASDYGSLALIKSIVVVSVTFGPLGLNIGLLKTLTLFDQAPALRAYYFQSFRAFVFLCNSVAPVAIFALAYFGHFLPRQSNGILIAFSIALVSLPFAADISLFGAYYRVTDRVQLFAKTSLIWQSLLTATTAVIAVIVFHNLIAVTVASTVSVIAIFSIFALRFHWESSSSRLTTSDQKLERTDFYRTIRESMWMACSTFAYVLLRNLDLIMLGRIVSPLQLGSYSLLSTVAYVIFVVPLALSQSLGPAVARSYANFDEVQFRAIYRSYFENACVISSFLATGIAIYGDRLGLVLGASYQISPMVAAPLAFGQLVSAVLGPTGFALSMTGHHKQEFALLFTATFLMAVSLYVVLPSFGLEGAAFASLFIYSCANVIRYVLVKHYTGIWVARWIDVYYPLVGIGLALTCRYFSRSLGDGLGASVVGCLAYTILFVGAIFFRAKLISPTPKLSSN